jgi:AraC-like DNA-binding protein
LQHLVRRYWEIDGWFAYARERELPRGDVAILINLAGRHAVLDGGDAERSVYFTNAWVCGMRDAHLITANEGRAWVVGARLTPEGGRRVTGVPANDLRNRVYCLSDVVGERAASDFVDQIRNANSPSDRFALIERFIIRCVQRRCRWPTPLRWAAEQLEAGAGVASVAESIGWSRGRLHRRFIENVGLSPKTYARVRRFHAALSAIKTAPTLTELAHAAGYSDQAHFTRDFSDFAGMSPSAYLRARAPFAEEGFAVETETFVQAREPAPA